MAKSKAIKKTRKSPNKVAVKSWLLTKGHKAKPDKNGDFLDLVAEYHDIDVEELRRLTTANL